MDEVALDDEAHLVEEVQEKLDDFKQGNNQGQVSKKKKKKRKNKNVGGFQETIKV